MFFDGIIVGFALLIAYRKIVHILYFAIDKNHQGKGYGHQALELMKTMYPKHIFIADIEKYEEDCPNGDMRRKRELFYLHDNYFESEIEYRYKGVDYILMESNGHITKGEFITFWKHFSYVDDLGKFITNSLK